MYEKSFSSCFSGSTSGRAMGADWTGVGRIFVRKARSAGHLPPDLVDQRLDQLLHQRPRPAEKATLLRRRKVATTTTFFKCHSFKPKERGNNTRNNTGNLAFEGTSHACNKSFIQSTIRISQNLGWRLHSQCAFEAESTRHDDKIATLWQNVLF